MAGISLCYEYWDMGNGAGNTPGRPNMFVDGEHGGVGSARVDERERPVASRTTLYGGGYDCGLGLW